MPIKDINKRREYDRERKKTPQSRERERIRSRKRRQDPDYKKWNREYSKRWREKNIEKVRRQWRKSYYKNIERVKEYRKKYNRQIGICLLCKAEIIGNRNKKYCDDCRKNKMREVFKGNQYWKLVKNRPRGPDNKNWKGGITYWKDVIYNSGAYKDWRRSILHRDSYTCQRCTAENGFGKKVILEVHHKIPFAALLRYYNIRSLEKALNNKILWRVDLGVTLCQPCHNLTKNGRPKKQESH